MKNAMIWGSNGGIGRALLQVLSQEGWNTIAVSRKPEALAEFTTLSLEADVSDPGAVQAAVYGAAQEVDQVELWVYAVGDILSSPIDDLDPMDWARISNANLNGAYLATHYSLPLLAEEAHLVYLGALSERLRLPGLGAYAAAKAGLEAFAQALSKEQRQRRVTVVRPAAVNTPLWEKVPMRLPKGTPGPEKVARRILEAHQEGHKGQLDLTA